MKKPQIVITIPVYNEEKVLANSIETLVKYFKENLKEYDWKIIIANNASRDMTKEIADSLCKKYKQVDAIHLLFKGRGNALRAAWTSTKADAVGYCDVDLATDINYLKPLFDSIIKEEYDIAIGNRYLPGANTKRTIGRLIYSKFYIWMLKSLFKTKLTDFQCGFKAIDRKVVENILPQVKDKEWFFDSELLLRAENKGYKIKELPVKWQENKDSKVNIIKTSYQYTRNLIKLRANL